MSVKDAYRIFQAAITRSGFLKIIANFFLAINLPGCGSGESGADETVSSEAGPAGPAEVHVNYGTGKNTINWTPVESAEYYYVYWSTELFTGRRKEDYYLRPEFRIGPINGTFFIHFDFTPGTTVYYCVTAVYPGGEESEPAFQPGSVVQNDPPTTPDQGPGGDTKDDSGNGGDSGSEGNDDNSDDGKDDDDGGDSGGGIIYPAASIYNPSNGSTLAGTTVTFQWNDVEANSHTLRLGSGAGLGDYLEKTYGPVTSATVGGLPSDGSLVHARLYSNHSGTIQHRDHAYTAFMNQSTITSPADGSTLTGSTINFSWTDTGADSYSLWVGSSSGASDYQNKDYGTATSGSVSGIPTDGSAVFARLFTTNNSVTKSADSSYTALFNKSLITNASPLASGTTTFTSTTISFSWSDAGADSYTLWVGSSQGANDYHSVNHGTNLSTSVSSLPTDGSAVFVRIITEHNSSTQFSDHNYTALFNKSILQAPADGSTLSSGSATFTWSDVGADSYTLWVGSSQGASDYYNQNRGTNLSASVSGLPTDGSPIYARLITEHNSSTQFNDYSYNALFGKSQMQSPTDGSTLSSGLVTFSWSDAGADSYTLWIGSSLGASDYHSTNHGTNLSAGAGGLPTDGSAIYARLITEHNSSTQFNDYSYTAEFRKSEITNSYPMASGATTFASSHVTFTWANTGANSYFLSVGSSQGGTNYHGASYGASTFTGFVTGLPYDSSAIHVRLSTTYNSGTEFNDYTYTAASASATPCFTADTSILLGDGTFSPISEIGPGDTVMGYDFTSQRRIQNRVTKLLKSTAPGYLEINGLKVTGAHPFATGVDQWTRAENLKVGDKIAGDGEIEIESVRSVDRPAEVFDLQVEGPANYFVSEGGRLYLVRASGGLVMRPKAVPRRRGRASPQRPRLTAEAAPLVRSVDRRRVVSPDL